MREKLELKIVAIVAVLLLLGIFGAGFMVLIIEKKSLYSITGSAAEATAKIIAKDVERVMLEGRADLTKTLVDDLKGASDIENISVLNFQGREAFNKAAPLTDADILKKMAETKMPRKINEKTRIIFYETLKNKDQCRACHANDPEVLGL